jgi:hypothetical protein
MPEICCSKTIFFVLLAIVLQIDAFPRISRSTHHRQRNHIFLFIPPTSGVLVSELETATGILSLITKRRLRKTRK